MRRLEMNGTVVWLAWSLLLAAMAAGCHGDTNQGGGTDKGHAVPNGSPQQVHQPVPTPPTADQVDPNSPQAVLDGTSTTQTRRTPQSSNQPQGHQQPQAPPAPNPQ